MRKHSLSIILFFLCLILSDVFSQTKVDWRQIKNTPTTVDGYGITDVVGVDAVERLEAEVERIEGLIPSNASFTYEVLTHSAGEVVEGYIADDAVTTDKIKDGGVTDAKIDTLSSRKLRGELTTATGSIMVSTDDAITAPTIHRTGSVSGNAGLVISGGDTSADEGLTGASIYLSGATLPKMELFIGAYQKMMEVLANSYAHPIRFFESVLFFEPIRVLNEIELMTVGYEPANRIYNQVNNGKADMVLHSEGNIKLDRYTGIHSLGVENDVTVLGDVQIGSGLLLKSGSSTGVSLIRRKFASGGATPGDYGICISGDHSDNMDGGCIWLGGQNQPVVDLRAGNSTITLFPTETAYPIRLRKDARFEGDIKVDENANFAGNVVAEGKLTVNGVNGLRVTGVAGAYIDSALAVGGNISHGGTSDSTPNLIISGGTTASNGSTLELSTGFKNKIELKTANGDTKLHMENGFVTITEDLKVAGNLLVGGDLAVEGSITIGGDLVFIEPKRWGIKITQDISDPYDRVEYLYDAAGMTPAYMNYSTGEFNYGDWEPFCRAINRPVMLKYNGEVDYELDWNDQTKKKDGTISDISNISYAGNAMAEFKRLWLSLDTDEDDNIKIVFSNVKYNDNYRAYTFEKEDGTTRDRMYLSMYQGSYVSPRLRSMAAGVLLADTPGFNFSNYALANGAGWGSLSWQIHDYIQCLAMLIGKTTDTMTCFGKPNNAAINGYLAPGFTVGAGQFWGSSTNTDALKIFYVENLWGNGACRMLGRYWPISSGDNLPPQFMFASPSHIRTGGVSNEGNTSYVATDYPLQQMVSKPYIQKYHATNQFGLIAVEGSATYDNNYYSIRWATPSNRLVSVIFHTSSHFHGTDFLQQDYIGTSYQNNRLSYIKE